MTPKRRTIPQTEILAWNTKTEDTGLDRQQIIETALQLLNDVGLKNLTTRRLAERLGVRSASLYWHIKDKDELLQLLADRISSDVSPVDANLPWTEQLIQFANGFRTALLTCRDAVELLTETTPFTLNRLRQIEFLYGLLIDAGFSYQESALIGPLINNYVMGFVKEEVRFNNLIQSRENKAEEIISSMQDISKSLPAEEFPTLRRLSEYAPTIIDMSQNFDYGLQILINGLNLRLEIDQINGICVKKPCVEPNA